MDAAPRSNSPANRIAARAPHGRLASILVLAGLAASLATAMSGCGSPQTHADLPDLATKSPKAPDNKNVMSSAEQKRAIDSMIARREEQERAAREAAGNR